MAQCSISFNHCLYIGVRTDRTKHVAHAESCQSTAESKHACGENSGDACGDDACVQRMHASNGCAPVYSNTVEEEQRPRELRDKFSALHVSQDVC